MWHYNKKVLRTYSSRHAQNAWALIEDVGGWKRIKPGATDGVTQLYIMMNAAKANSRLVSVNVNSDDQIDIAYLR